MIEEEKVLEVDFECDGENLSTGRVASCIVDEYEMRGGDHLVLNIRSDDKDIAIRLIIRMKAGEDCDGEAIGVFVGDYHWRHLKHTVGDISWLARKLGEQD